MVTSIESLPNELVIEILAHVGASSSTDLFSAKLSCKTFCGAADDDYIFQRVSLERFPVVPWRINEKVVAFLNRCRESGNPEALYRQGVVDYFSFMRLEYGLECLEKAASSGHSGAQYVLGIVLLFRGNEFKRQGMQLLIAIKKANVSRKLSDCRAEWKAIVRKIWVRNPFAQRQRPVCCAMRGADHHKRRRGWESDDEDDIQCDACRCDTEADYVFDILPCV